MHPIPCSHCGNNYMRPTLDPQAPRLCNNCNLREEKRINKKEDKMTTVDILVKCPREVHIEIEEICIAQGIDFSQYFMRLHKEDMKLKYDLAHGYPDYQEVNVDPKPSGKPDYIVHEKDFKKEIPKKKGNKK